MCFHVCVYGVCVCVCVCVSVFVCVYVCVCVCFRLKEEVSYLVFSAESTTEDYNMAKNNVQSVSYLLCTQVIKPQIIPNHKISPDTNLRKTKHTQSQTSNTKFSKN